MASKRIRHNASLRGYLRHVIRHAAAGSRSRHPIAVVPGDDPPAVRGEPGKRIREPKTSQQNVRRRVDRRGEITWYQPSSTRIEVGREWVEKHLAHLVDTVGG